ncbi:MAG: hypothetical protein ACRDIV_26085, partial [Ktedonobacteraceae bacterium]
MAASRAKERSTRCCQPHLANDAVGMAGSGDASALYPVYSTAQRSASITLATMRRRQKHGDRKGRHYYRR